MTVQGASNGLQDDVVIMQAQSCLGRLKQSRRKPTAYLSCLCQEDLRPYAASKVKL